MAASTSAFTGTENPLSEGGVWDSGPGSWVGVQKGVTAGEVEATAGGDNAASYAVATRAFTSDQTSTVTLGFQAWAAQVVRGGALVRMQGTGANQGDCYGFFGDDNVPDIRLYRLDDAAGAIGYTQLGSAVTETPVATDTLTCEAVGTSIKGYRNSVLKITQTDATYANGQPGFAIREGSYTPAGLRFTDWSGDDVGGGGGASVVPVLMAEYRQRKG